MKRKFEKDGVENTRKTGCKYEKKKLWKYVKDRKENMRKMGWKYEKIWERNGGKTNPSLLPRRRYSCGQWLDCVMGLNRNRIQLTNSRRANQWGAYFSAVFGRKFNPTTVLRPCQPLACCWRVGIAPAPTLFTTSTNHHGSRWCGWSDLSLLFISICDTEQILLFFCNPLLPQFLTWKGSICVT